MALTKNNATTFYENINVNFKRIERFAAIESHKDLRLTTTNIKLILENPTGFSKS